MGYHARTAIVTSFPFHVIGILADNLLRWHDAQHFSEQASTRLKPNAHGNCARFIPA